ncbi:MAG TPA: hypothetical protein V6C95_12095 [Coleofasciculaceae cyanobacterium]
MAAATTFNSWCVQSQRILRGELSAPSSSGFRLLLCNGGVDRTSTMNEIADAEVSGNGYSRQALDFAGAGTVEYSNTTRRADIPALSVTVTASGGAIEFDTLVVVADSNNTVGGTTGEPVFFVVLNSQSIADGVAQPIIIQGWGSANIGSNRGV